MMFHSWIWTTIFIGLLCNSMRGVCSYSDDSEVPENIRFLNQVKRLLNIRRQYQVVVGPSSPVPTTGVSLTPSSTEGHTTAGGTVEQDTTTHVPDTTIPPYTTVLPETTSVVPEDEDEMYKYCFGLVDYVMENYVGFPNEIREANLTFENLWMNIEPVMQTLQGGPLDLYTYDNVLSAIARFIGRERMECPDVAASRILNIAVGITYMSNLTRYQFGEFMVGTVIRRLTHHNSHLVDGLNVTLVGHLQAIFDYTGKYIMLEYSIDKARNLLTYLSMRHSRSQFDLGPELFKQYMHGVWNVSKSSLQCGTVDDYSRYLAKSAPQLLIRSKLAIVSSSLKAMNEKMPASFFNRFLDRIVSGMDVYLNNSGPLIGTFFNIVARKKYRRLIGFLQRYIGADEMAIVDEVFEGERWRKKYIVESAKADLRDLRRIIAIYRDLDLPPNVKYMALELIMRMYNRKITVIDAARNNRTLVA